MEFFIFKDAELPFDITDIQTAQRLQLALDGMEKGADGCMDSERFCELVRAFFDCALGSGAAAELFGQRRSAGECESAFLALVDCVNAQQESTSLRRQRLYEAAITPAGGTT